MDSGEGNRRGGGFPDTRWSVIASARAGGERGLARLCEDYWRPVFSFVRRRGHEEQEAKDLTQGFFQSILGRPFLRDVAPEHGRFRAFLIQSLKHFLSDAYDRKHAQKRNRGQPALSFDDERPEGQSGFQIADRGPGPDLLFDQEWARALLNHAYCRLQEECARSHRRLVLNALAPILYRDDDSPTYKELADRLGMSEAAVKVCAMRMRQRLTWLIIDQIRRTLTNESEVDAELSVLMAAFARH